MYIKTTIYFEALGEDNLAGICRDREDFFPSVGCAARGVVWDLVTDMGWSCLKVAPGCNQLQAGSAFKPGCMNGGFKRPHFLSSALWSSIYVLCEL